MVNISIKKNHSFLGHTDSVYCLEVASETEFFSAGGDGNVILWNLHNPNGGEIVAKLRGSVYAMAYDPDEKLLYIGQNYEGIHKIDLKRKKKLASIHLGQNQIFDIKISDHGIWVALSSGELVALSKELKMEKRKQFTSEKVRSIHEVGDNLAISFSDHKIRLVEKANLEVLQELSGHKNSVFSSKLHTSGKYLASVGRDAQIKIWDTQENYILRESINAHLHTINDIVFRSDGRYFATASMDKSIKLWDAYNFKLLKVIDKQRYQGHSNSINNLLWMKYDNLLVSCSDDKSIFTWEINFEE